MKFYRNLFFLLILTHFYPASAQNNIAKIAGEVADFQNYPLKGVTVYLLRSADSSVVRFAISDRTGTFVFSGIPSDNYMVAAEASGFLKTYSHHYMLKKEGTTDIGILQLKKDNATLTTVDIVSERPFVEIKAGKTVLNIQNSITSTGSSAYEIIRKAAGVKIDNEGNISLNNRSNVTVLIDNKPVNIPQNALVDMLQGIQSSTIDQIELIDNPGAKYDAGSGGGVINIKTLRSESYGTNGSINGTLGSQQLDNGYGSRLKGNIGITFNNRVKKFNVYGNYTYTYNPVDRIYLTDRLVNYNSTATELTANYFSDQAKKINVFKLGADYDISPKQVIGFVINGSETNFIQDKTTNTNILTNGLSDSTVTTGSRLDSHAWQVAFDLNYKIKLNKAGEISADANYFTYDRNPQEVINSGYFNSATHQLYRSLTIQNSFPSNYKIYTYKIEYNLPLSASSTFTAIAKTDQVTTHNNLDFGEVVSKVYHPDPKFTNQFDFTETVNAGALIYNKTFNKKVSMELGLRLEQTVSDGMEPKSDVKNNYFDIFPEVKATDDINDDNKLHFSYTNNIYRPNYPDLNPFIAYQDQYSYYMGNPYLKATYIHAIELQHIYRGKFSTSVFFIMHTNYIQAVLVQNDSSKIIINKKLNLGDQYQYGVKIDHQTDITAWWASNCEVKVSYEQLSATATQGLVTQGSWDGEFDFIESFNLYKGIKTELTGKLETPTDFGVFRYKSAAVVNLSVGKTVSKQFSLTAQVSDIFNSERNRLTGTYQNLNVTANDKISFRTLTVNLAYKFGSTKVKAERKRATGAETEQGRVNPNGPSNSPQQ